MFFVIFNQVLYFFLQLLVCYDITCLIVLILSNIVIKILSNYWRLILFLVWLLLNLIGSLVYRVLPILLILTIIIRSVGIDYSYSFILIKIAVTSRRSLNKILCHWKLQIIGIIFYRLILTWIDRITSVIWTCTNHSIYIIELYSWSLWTTHSNIWTTLI
jgi:hypothetical protein